MNASFTLALFVPHDARLVEWNSIASGHDINSPVNFGRGLDSQHGWTGKGVILFFEDSLCTYEYLTPNRVFYAILPYGVSPRIHDQTHDMSLRLVLVPRWYTSTRYFITERPVRPFVPNKCPKAIETCHCCLLRDSARPPSHYLLPAPM